MHCKKKLFIYYREMDKKNLPANIEPTIEPLKKNYKGPLRRVEVSKILEGYLKGLPLDDIARVVNRTLYTVQCCLQEHKDILKIVTDNNPEHYRSVRKDLLNAAEFLAVKSVTDEDAIKQASLRDRVYMLRETHAVRRLEEGQSTSNTAVDIKYTKVNLPKLDE
jgi:hypothetical protein